MPIKQSFCYPMYATDTIPPDEFFRQAAAIGYEAVEFWARDQYEDYNALFGAARDAGMAIASMVGHANLGDGMNKHENHDRIEAEIRQSLAVAREFEIPGQSDLEGLRTCAKILRRLAPLAEEANVNLNIELLNSKIDHPGYQCDRSDWGFALCDMVGSSNVKVLYDIYHMQIMEGDIIRTMTANIDFVGHVHTAGNPGRTLFDASQELSYKGICAAIV